MSRRQGLLLLGLLLFRGGSPCLADSVSALSSGETASPGTPVNSLELADLGIDPNLFLLTGNSMYNFSGDSILDLIGADIDPSQSSLVPVQEDVIDLSGSGDGGTVTSGSNASSATPEPSTVSLVVLGSLLLAGGIWLTQLRRT